MSNRKHTIMRKYLFVFLLLLASTSCIIRDKQQTLTFDDIEEEFQFPRTLSETSRQIILERFGTLEKYREHLLTTDSIAAGKKRTKASIYRSELKADFDTTLFIMRK